MGFEFHSKTQASFVFKRTYDLPTVGTYIDVEVSFFPKKVQWVPETLPLKTFKPKAILDEAGTIHLQHRVAVYTDTEEFSGSAVVKVCTGGKVVCFDKARYAEAEKVGVIYNSGVFYLDQIHA